jgi:tetratricopeptide (TPR) repeat protein
LFLAALSHAVLGAEEKSAVKPTPTVEEKALIEVERLLEAQEWGSAAEQARPLTEETQEARIRLVALERLSVALAGIGEAKESEQIAEQAEILFQEQEKARLAKSSVYYRNRSAYDGVRSHAVALLRKRQAAAEAAGYAKQVVPVAVSLARRFPAHPQYRSYALQAAEQLHALGREDDATPWFVAALDTGLDRSFMTKAKLGENQAQLDAISKPLSLDHVTRALAGLSAKTPPTEKANSDASSSASRFQAALGLTRKPDTEAAVAGLAALAAESPFDQSPLADIVRLELARTHLRAGHAYEGAQVLNALQPQRGGLLNSYTPFGRAVAARQQFLLGVAANLSLDRQAAAEHFSKAAKLAKTALHETALYEQARTLELAGDWRTARELYDKLVKRSPATWVRCCASISLARLEELGEQGRPKDDRHFLQLPDDRETHGDWHLGYGTEYYVLCAHNYVQDITGGPGPKLKLSFSTTDPKEPSRLWVSQKATDDPAALWDPRRRVRFPANRDDRGEQYAIGDGPDLLMGTVLPAGQHILSMYFVNDHHYYEANRRYTLEIRQDGKLLGMADVRDFGVGVYKRFLLSGPGKLDVRFRRDASMNVLLQGVFLDRVPELDSLPAMPLAGNSSQERVYGLLAQRLAFEPNELLSHTSPLVAAATTRPQDGKQSRAWGYYSHRLLVAAGRPRAAYAAFSEFARALPAEAIVPVAQYLATRMQSHDHLLRMRTTEWLPGQHPLDLLNARWFDSILPQTPADDTAAKLQPDAVAALKSIATAQEPQSTPFAQKHALEILDRLSPDSVSADFLCSMGTELKSVGDTAQAASVLQRALAGGPDERTRFRAAQALLIVGPKAGLSLADTRSLYAEALQLAKHRHDDHAIPSIHLHAANAVASHGSYQEAIDILNQAPTAAGQATLLANYREQMQNQSKKTESRQ